MIFEGGMRGGIRLIEAQSLIIWMVMMDTMYAMGGQDFKIQLRNVGRQLMILLYLIPEMIYQRDSISCCYSSSSYFEYECTLRPRYPPIHVSSL
jgi:hypothetical protein